jgi:hypothetical protein
MVMSRPMAAAEATRPLELRCQRCGEAALEGRGCWSLGAKCMARSLWRAEAAGAEVPAQLEAGILTLTVSWGPRALMGVGQVMSRPMAAAEATRQ